MVSEIRVPTDSRGRGGRSTSSNSVEVSGKNVIPVTEEVGQLQEDCIDDEGEGVFAQQGWNRDNRFASSTCCASPKACWTMGTRDTVSNSEAYVLK